MIMMVLSGLKVYESHPDQVRLLQCVGKKFEKNSLPIINLRKYFFNLSIDIPSNVRKGVMSSLI